jgi:hypothetical protein
MPGAVDAGIRVEATTQSSPPITLKRTCRPDDPGCERPRGPVDYSVTLVKKTLTLAGSKQSYTYCDRAGVTRHAVPPARDANAKPAVTKP